MRALSVPAESEGSLVLPKVCAGVCVQGFLKHHIHQICFRRCVSLKQRN